MSPVFMTRNLKDTGYARCVGGDDRHLKARLFQKENNRSFDAIGFDLGKKCDLVAKGKTVKAAYCIEENEFQGNISLQLKLKDLEIN
jgi:single-stranded-DNA-specific exonuclease